MIEKVAYGGWPNCVRLANAKIELIATTDVGPRILRLAPIGGANIFHEYHQHAGRSGDPHWLGYGGHRLWHAPEHPVRTYQPDNEPVRWEGDGKTLRLYPPVEKVTGIRKEIEVRLHASDPAVTVVHRLINEGAAGIELAPWALTMMAQGGRAIIQQEPPTPHPDSILPVRPLILWSYTDMSDPRFRWGKRTFEVRQDSSSKLPQKIGVRSTTGWAAFERAGHVFLKHAPLNAGSQYTDFGANIEIFTDHHMLEVESLGPLTRLAPNGGCVEHWEDWYLLAGELGEGDDTVADRLAVMISDAMGLAAG